jgi:hypothetical protein
MFGMGTKKICTNCGTVDIPVCITKGSLIIEIFLWLLLIVPGLIYSIWRLSSKYKACPACKSKNPIGLNTPRGVKLMDEYNQ